MNNNLKRMIIFKIMILILYCTISNIYSRHSINFFNAIWVFVGTASSKDIFLSGFKPFCSKVQTPEGPLECNEHCKKFDYINYKYYIFIIHINYFFIYTQFIYKHN